MFDNSQVHSAAQSTTRMFDGTIMRPVFSWRDTRSNEDDLKVGIYPPLLEDFRLANLHGQFRIYRTYVQIQSGITNLYCILHLSQVNVNWNAVFLHFVCETSQLKLSNAIVWKLSKCHQTETKLMPSGWNPCSKCHQAETQEMPSSWNSANAIRLKLSKFHQAETQQCHQAENQQCHWAERALKLSSLIGLLSSKLFIFLANN